MSESYENTEDGVMEPDLFLGTIKDWDEYDKQNKIYVAAIDASVSLRLIVLESWLFVDYTIRFLLMSGLGLLRFDDHEIDLRYNLLPDLKRSARLIQAIRDSNRGRPEKPEQPFEARRRKWKHFDDFEPGLRKRIGAAEDSYFKQFGLPDSGSSGLHLCNSQPEAQYKFVSEGWLDIADQIDREWMRRAEKLNGARNLAAHCHDEMRVAKRLGFHGPDALAQAKEECLRISKYLVERRSERPPAP